MKSTLILSVASRNFITSELAFSNIDSPRRIIGLAKVLADVCEMPASAIPDQKQRMEYFNEVALTSVDNIMYELETYLPVALSPFRRAVEIFWTTRYNLLYGTETQQYIVNEKHPAAAAFHVTNLVPESMLQTLIQDGMAKFINQSKKLLKEIKDAEVN